MRMNRGEMRCCLAAGVLVLMACIGGPFGAGCAFAVEPGERSGSAPPAWLYPVNPADDAGPAPDPKALRHVAGSALTYTNEQVDDLFIAPDWHPQAHAPAPAVVTRGRPPDTYACGYCHRITGAGAPENAHLAGLPAAYIRTQLEDLRSGTRRSSRPERIPQAFMTVAAKSLNDAEIDAAARYFAAQPRTTTFRVVESRTAPGVHTENWSLAANQPATLEPLGHRLLELPDNPQDFTSRDTRARFTVYVPVGSVERGRALVERHDANACAACHGQRLQGQGIAPPLVGQSPSYLLRQLVDFSRGTRNGTQAGPMAAVARALSMDDMIAVASYAASNASPESPSKRQR